MENFSIKVKNELISQQFNKKKFMDFIFGLFFSSKLRENDYFQIQITNNKLRKTFCNLLKRFKIEFFLKNRKLDIYFSKNLKDFSFQLIQNIEFFMAAIFFNVGSINNLKNTYHLELKFYFEEELNMIEKVLSDKKYQFNFHSLKRKKYWILYSKSKDSINYYLRIINARQSFFDFLNTTVERDYESNQNKYLNLEVNNIKKIISASLEHISNYDFICKKNLQHLFKNEEIIFFELRKNYQYSSLNELTKLLALEKNIFRTKGGLNHWLRKLKQIVSEYKIK